MQDYKAQLQSLLLNYLSIAHDQLGQKATENLGVNKFQRLLILMAETIELEYLMDKTIIHHALEQLQQSQKPEQAAMHCFVLYIYKLCITSSKHPLEEGVIKQKIINILPMFEKAVNQGLIDIENYDKNADALAHIADNSAEVPAILQALTQEYQRLTPNEQAFAEPTL